MPKFIKLETNSVAGDFYVCIADKHYSIKNTVQLGKNAIQPGDYIVVDEHMNTMVFSRQEFKANFGHQALQVMDAIMEEAE